MSLCAVLLVAASVLGTMAYLTDSKDVKNTFTVGNVAITLDEAKVDGNGNAINKQGKRVTNLADAERVPATRTSCCPATPTPSDPTVTVLAPSVSPMSARRSPSTRLLRSLLCARIPSMVMK